MGAWGVKLDQNDIYADVKDFYTALLRYGKSNEEALKHTLNFFAAYAADPEDGDLFRLSLADIMWNAGRLTDDVKEKALACIDSSKDTEKWYEVSKESGDKRREILEDLKKRLMSEQRAVKKFGKKRYKRCTWADGDIYRYSFTGEEAEKYDMTGMYMILQKDGEYFEPDYSLKAIKSVIGDEDGMNGDLLPIIRFWITDDKDFIPSADDRNDCIANIGNKDRHKPDDYRFYIFDFPGKSDRFEFICNKDIIIPDDEDEVFSKNNKIKPKHLTWKFFDKHVIGRYLFWTKDINIFR